MPENPIADITNQVPGSSPIQPTPPLGHEKPSLGAEEGTQGRQFQVGPDPSKAGPEKPETERPSPMQVAGDNARQQPQMAPDVLSDHISKLQNQLDSINDKIRDPQINKNFTGDHYKAMEKVTQKMNPDMQTIAKNSKGEFTPPQQGKGQSTLDHVADWIQGAQGTLGGALNFLQNTTKPDITSYMRLQYAIQRATQRGELFASIVGSSVSGIKTIMSTQLG